MLEIIRALISSIILTTSLYAFGLTVFKEKKNQSKTYNLIAFLVGNILSAFVFSYSTGTIKTILLCIVFTFMMITIFKTEFDKSLFASIIYVIILVIPDLLTTMGTIYVIGIDKEYYYAHLAGGIANNTSVCILTIILIYILKKPLKKLMNYNALDNQRVILTAFLTLGFLAFFFYNLIKTFEFTNNIISYVIVIVALIIFLFAMFKQKIDNDKLQNKYDELLEIMKNYESDVEYQRTQLHETKNEFMTIKSKINDKENNKEIIKYIDSIIGEKINTSNMLKYAKFTYLPANGLKGFFYYKFMEAERNKINVFVNISQNIENSFLGKLEANDFKQLARIIGVYLDNAIEASSQSEERKLGIEIYMVKKDIKIIITNTFVNNIDSDKIGKLRFSTKGINRGHGLLLVKSILSTNKMFEAKRTIKDNLYIQELLIKEDKETK